MEIISATATSAEVRPRSDEEMTFLVARTKTRKGWKFTVEQKPAAQTPGQSQLLIDEEEKRRIRMVGAHAMREVELKAGPLPIERAYLLSNTVRFLKITTGLEWHHAAWKVIEEDFADQESDEKIAILRQVMLILGPEGSRLADWLPRPFKPDPLSRTRATLEAWWATTKLVARTLSGIKRRKKKKDTDTRQLELFSRG